MSKPKKYDIGHGVIVTAESFGIRASWGKDGTSHSIGLSWPINPPEKVEVVWSRNGSYYYPRGLSKAIHGFWMSNATYATEEDAKGAIPPSPVGKMVAWFVNGNQKYYRSLLNFCEWDIKSSKETTFVSKDDPLVFDYAGIVGNQWLEDEAKFNEAIAFTGRNAREIIEKIGVYNEEPEEEPLPTPI